MLKYLYATALALLITGAANAQTPGSGGPTLGAADPNPPTSVPLDGGASLLLAGGAAYVLRRLHQRRSR